MPKGRFDSAVEAAGDALAALAALEIEDFADINGAVQAAAVLCGDLAYTVRRIAERVEETHVVHPRITDRLWDAADVQDSAAERIEDLEDFDISRRT